MEKIGRDTGGGNEDRNDEMPDRKWEYFERDSDSETCPAVLSEEKVACLPMSVGASPKPKEQEKNKLCPFCQMKTEDFNFHLRIHDSCGAMHQMKVVLEAKIQSREKQLEATKLELSAEKEKYEKTLKEEIKRHKEEMNLEILKHSKKEVDMQDLIFKYEYELAETKKRLADEQRKQKKNLKKYINVLKEFHLKHRQILKAEGHDIDQGVPIETQTKETQTDPDFVSSTEIKDDTRPDEAFARGENRAARENSEKLKRIMEKDLQQEGTPKEDLDIPGDDSQEDKRSHSRSNSRSSSRSNSRSCSWSRSRSRSRSLSWYEEYDSDTKQGSVSGDDDNYGDDDDDDEDDMVGASILSPQPECLAEHTVQKATSDVSLNDRGRKRKRQLFNESPGPQLFAQMYDK